MNLCFVFLLRQQNKTRYNFRHQGAIFAWSRTRTYVLLVSVSPAFLAAIHRCKIPQFRVDFFNNVFCLSNGLPFIANLLWNRHLFLEHHQKTAIWNNGRNVVNYLHNKMRTKVRRITQIVPISVWKRRWPETSPTICKLTLELSNREPLDLSNCSDFCPHLVVKIVRCVAINNAEKNQRNGT